MNTFLLAITILLLFITVKNTPANLSKRQYLKKVEPIVCGNIRRHIEAEKQGKSIEDIKKEQSIEHVILASLVLIIEILLVIYYSQISKIIGTTTFRLLSSAEIATVCYNFESEMALNIFSENIEDFKFRRIPCLINLTLDYIYYISIVCYATGWYR